MLSRDQNQMSGEKQGYLTIALTVFILVFFALPMDLFRRAKESAKEAVADKAVQQIDVVILSESNEDVTRRLLAAVKQSNRWVAEFYGCRLYLADLQAQLPEGYIQPIYLQVQDDGIVFPIYAVLPSLEAARQWLSEHGYSDADFEFNTISSDTLGGYIHRKPLGGNYFHRSEIVVSAFSKDGGYYIHDFSVSPNSDLESYRAFMKARQ